MADEVNGTNGQTPAAGTTPPAAPAPAAGATSPALFNSIVPQEFQDRPYLKPLLEKPLTPEAYNELFKKLDGAEKLVGKKTGIPDSATATPEEWEQFYAKLRPETADAYEFKSKDGAPPPDAEFVKGIKGIFHKAGLTKHQAALVQEQFDAFVGEKVAAKVEAEKKLDAEFEAMTAKAFGADNAKTLESAKVLMNDLTPDELKPYLAKLPNEALVVLTGIMGAVRAKYVGEDRVAPGAGTTDNGGNAREEARKLMATEAYKDPWHKDHAATKARVESIYATFSTKK